MALTLGLNHLGLAVKNLDQTTSFFVEVLDWTETARDESYPRTTVTDGSLRLTLWQTSDGARDFDRHTQIGLHPTRILLAVVAATNAPKHEHL